MNDLDVTLRSLTAALLALGACSSIACGQSAFATRVVSYEPVGVVSPAFSDPSRALGAPVGGSPSVPDNSKIVSLGAWSSPLARGGRITLAFDAPIANLPATPANPRGADLIIFGNAFYVAGNANRRFAEAGIVEVSRDNNANGLADDAWFIIPGSHLGGDSMAVSLPLPASVFALPNGQPIVNNPLGLDATDEGIWGYADCTPTIALGDLDADGEIDAPSLAAERFYTVPDDSRRVGIDRFSGGGDAIDISTAIDAATGAPANLASVDFVRVSTGVNATSAALGAISTEISGVSRVIVRARADVAGANQSPGPDGVRSADDIIVYLSWYFAASPLADVAGPNQSEGPDGLFSADDIIVFLSWYFASE